MWRGRHACGVGGVGGAHVAWAARMWRGRRACGVGSTHVAWAARMRRGRRGRRACGVGGVGGAHVAWAAWAARMWLRSFGALAPAAPFGVRRNCATPVEGVLNGTNLAQSRQRHIRPAVGRLLGRHDVPAHACAGMIRSRDPHSTPPARGPETTARLNPSLSTTPTGIEQKPHACANRPHPCCPRPHACANRPHPCCPRPLPVPPVPAPRAARARSPCRPRPLPVPPARLRRPRSPSGAKAREYPEPS